MWERKWLRDFKLSLTVHMAGTECALTQNTVFIVDGGLLHWYRNMKTRSWLCNCELSSYEMNCDENNWRLSHWETLCSKVLEYNGNSMNHNSNIHPSYISAHGNWFSRWYLKRSQSMLYCNWYGMERRLQFIRKEINLKGLKLNLNPRISLKP